MSDSFVGQLVFFAPPRHSQKGTALYNLRTRKSERISRLMVLKADSREDVDVAYSGDIFAIVGAKEVITGYAL